jgi:MFS superfamily sulfate permease-like transporter
VGDAWLIISRIFTGGLSDPMFPVVALGLVMVLWVYQFMYESKLRWMLELTPVRVGMVVAAIVYMAVFTAPGAQSFIYFQF